MDDCLTAIVYVECVKRSWDLWVECKLSSLYPTAGEKKVFMGQSLFVPQTVFCSAIVNCALMLGEANIGTSAKTPTEFVLIKNNDG